MTTTYFSIKSASDVYSAIKNRETRIHIKDGKFLNALDLIPDITVASYDDPAYPV